MRAVLAKSWTIFCAQRISTRNLKTTNISYASAEAARWRSRYDKHKRACQRLSMKSNATTSDELPSTHHQHTNQETSVTTSQLYTYIETCIFYYLFLYIMFIANYWFTAK